MFKVPLESIGKGSPLRQKGKVAELACIAENELVLTHVGLVPIQEITTDHFLWDGKEWIQHEGLIQRGEKEVFTYDGLTATADHLVFIEGQSEPIQFGVAATSGSRIIQSGIGRYAVRVGGDYQRRKEIRKRLACTDGFDEMYRMSKYSMDEFLQLKTWTFKRLPGLLSTAENTGMVVKASYRRKTKMHKSERAWIQKLRCKGYRLSVPVSARSRVMDDSESRFSEQRYGNRQNRRERTLRAGKHSLGYTLRQQNQSTTSQVASVEPIGMAVCEVGSDKKTSRWFVERRDYSRRGNSRVRKTEELARDKKTVRVYDILNAGPRNRFTVSGKLVHNCGYQGGVNALKAMGADKMGLSDDELKEIIHSWRKANPAIVKLWANVEETFKDQIQHGSGRWKVPPLVYDLQKNVGFIELPSGRRLAYVKPKLEPHPKFEGKEHITYDGVNQITRKWTRLSTYGGKLVENVVQAIARDCLAESLVRLEKAGYKTVMHVHDEVVLEVERGVGSAEEVGAIMGQSLDWAPGLPLTADAFETDYYRKD
jgi:DNA polymerase